MGSQFLSKLDVGWERCLATQEGISSLDMAKKDVGK